MPEPQAMAQASIQSHVRDSYEHTALILALASGTEVLPAWWSFRRDIELRRFWKKVDPLAGAVYALESKMATIPFRVEPKDYTIRAHQDQADRFEWMLNNATEWGRGWPTFFGKWTQDLITQDNGAFAEIVGEGDPAGPIMGMPLSVVSMDSARCTRTSNPEFPVVYQATDGKRYRLHYTRVAFSSLQPSPIAEMHDVGFCSVSKCLNIAQNLLDILIYNQEKLGSRPTRSMMVTSGGLDPEDIRAAFSLANEAQDNAMLSRFSKTVVVGSSAIQEGKIETHDLSSLPDGFSYETSFSIGLAAIALAFGVDARELWPMTSTGSTRADALIQHLKAQTKGIGHLLAVAEQAIFAKVLPETVTATFDYSDDAQDMQVAEIKKTRSDRHMVDLTQTRSVDKRTIREQMLSDGDITQAQFETMELEDGRLDDGSPVLQVFYDPEYRSLLRLGLPDPLDTFANDRENVRQQSLEVRKDLIRKLGVQKSPRDRVQILTALAALDALEKWYKDASGEREPVPPLLPFRAPGEPFGSESVFPNLAQEQVISDDLATVSPDEL